MPALADPRIGLGHSPASGLKSSPQGPPIAGPRHLLVDWVPAQGLVSTGNKLTHFSESMENKESNGDGGGGSGAENVLVSTHFFSLNLALRSLQNTYTLAYSLFFFFWFK